LRSTILVVDDEEIVRLSCLRVLTEAGYRVETATDGMEALRMTREKEYRLVILDIMMPQLDGFTVLQAIRGEHPRMEFIIITGLDQTSMSIRAAEMGVAAYIGKPFDPDELLAKVSHVLGPS
jgi:DNA-binding response OmpR family regulator